MAAPEIIINDEYLTKREDLKKVANAIRTKGGTVAMLAYPDEFVTAINNIQASSGGIDIKSDELTPDCYLCNKDDQTAYLDFSNVITGKYFSFGIMLSGTIFDPDCPDDEYDGSTCLICGMYSGDDSNTSPDFVLMKSNSDSGLRGNAMPIIQMKYNPITKRIDVSYLWEVAKGDAIPSAIDTIYISYVINWN